MCYPELSHIVDVSCCLLPRDEHNRRKTDLCFNIDRVADGEEKWGLEHFVPCPRVYIGWLNEWMMDLANELDDINDDDWLAIDKKLGKQFPLMSLLHSCVAAQAETNTSHPTKPVGSNDAAKERIAFICWWMDELDKWSRKHQFLLGMFQERDTECLGVR